MREPKKIPAPIGLPSVFACPFVVGQHAQWTDKHTNGERFGIVASVHQIGTADKPEWNIRVKPRDMPCVSIVWPNGVTGHTLRGVPVVGQPCEYETNKRAAQRIKRR